MRLFTLFTLFTLIRLQVETALLVAGSTLTFWIPQLHLPARTQASFQALGSLVPSRKNRRKNPSGNIAHNSWY